MGCPTLLFYMEAIRKKITELADSTADGYGLQIAGIDLAGSSRKLILRVFIDREDGVTLDDCERFSRALSAVLDVEDLIQASYILEVSSPGLNKQLKGVKDFEKNIGKLIRIITNQDINKQNFFVGRIIEVKNENVKLLIDNKIEIVIHFDQISKARLEIELR